MKKLLTSAALALTLTAAGMTSYAVNWVYLGQDGNDRIYYDTASKIEYDRNGNVKKIETFHESDFGWKKVKENSEEELLYKQIVNKPATASL